MDGHFSSGFRGPVDLKVEKFVELDHGEDGGAGKVLI